MSEDEGANDGRSEGLGEEPQQVAAHLAQVLRDAGRDCAIFNPVTTETAVLRWDRIVIGLALILLTALAWSYLLWLSADMGMGGMDMTGFRMIPAGQALMMTASAPWQPIEFGYVFVMWAVMMIGMMTPSAAPMILVYARLGRLTSTQGAPFSATAWFAAGYFLAWVAFALLATMAQRALEQAGMLDFEMASTSNVLGGVLFVAAGTYEWTRLKNVCLAQCQAPFVFLIRRGGFRHDALGSVLLGLRHGTYCVGCCWVLMALLFVGGVMNMHWIVLLASLVLLEKVAFIGRLITRLAGIVLTAAGAWILSVGMS